MAGYILCVAMAFGSMMGVSAAEVYTEGYYQYFVEDQSVTILSYFGNEEEVHVPSSIAGDPVNVIASGAFSGCESVRVIYLPDTIMSAENGAFGEKQSIVYNSNQNHDVPQTTVAETKSKDSITKTEYTTVISSESTSTKQTLKPTNAAETIISVATETIIISETMDDSLVTSDETQESQSDEKSEIHTTAIQAVSTDTTSVSEPSQTSPERKSTGSLPVIAVSIAAFGGIIAGIIVFLKRKGK